MLRYKRVLIKLSGGALAGKEGTGFDPVAIDHIVSQVLSVADLGVQVVILSGGGNIFRGNVSDMWGIERAEADNIGVMGTVINSLMLRGAITAKSDKEVRVMSAVPMNAIAEPYIRLRAIHHLDKEYIVILAGGIGQPYVTTDYASMQRALELRCDALLAAKHGVDGIYNADPNKDPSARRFKTLSYDDIVKNDLRVMDQSALLLARDYGLPLHVFNFDEQGTMKQIVQGKEEIGTYISPNTSMSYA
ncbi:uridylate kinase [Seinonella peptonophila]|uniref:Uridylate kinase n=1 Tax=Seinonella peptonophila TaxID=112248 RepID=A0A1M5BP84_9BACL|nr:UMP kinase [Seinonella peptonophila]SHF44220.1 uridylate kinase [Seinonella peptonophila]